MIHYSNRSHEEQALLNPGFCANILWHAARGYTGEKQEAISFEECFLILPLVLHRETRESLPRTIRTSLPVWLQEYPLSRNKIASRARMLAPFTKEAITFGGMHDFFKIENGKLFADNNWKRVVKRIMKDSSDEVNECAKKADFVGKWFAQIDDASTVLALIGVRP